MPGKYLESFDGTRIFYELKKKGPRFLMFLHGWPHNHTVWEKEVKYFVKKGYSTISVDLRGHGKSGVPEDFNDYSLENFAKDIEAIRKKEGLKSFVLAGHSFGGMIALEYYDLFPDKISSLLLVDTAYENPLKHSGFFKHFDLTPMTEHVLKFIMSHEKIKKKHFRYVDFSKFNDHSDFFFWIKGEEETAWKCVLACLEDIMELDKKSILKKIAVPTLIIEGQKDVRTPPDIAKKMAKDIKGAELKIIKGASHDTNIRCAYTVEKDIEEFLNKINY